MARVRLPFDRKRMSGCYGLSMEDGTRYTANNRGVIDVERPDHLRAMARHGKVDMDTSMPTGFRDVKVETEIYCPRCHHRGWKFNLKTGCPRCKGEMLETAAE